MGTNLPISDPLKATCIPVYILQFPFPQLLRVSIRASFLVRKPRDPVVSLLNCSSFLRDAWLFLFLFLSRSRCLFHTFLRSARFLCSFSRTPAPLVHIYTALPVHHCADTTACSSHSLLPFLSVSASFSFSPFLLHILGHTIRYNHRCPLTFQCGPCGLRLSVSRPRHPLSPFAPSLSSFFLSSLLFSGCLPSLLLVWGGGVILLSL